MVPPDWAAVDLWKAEREVPARLLRDLALWPAQTRDKQHTIRTQTQTRNASTLLPQYAR